MKTTLRIGIAVVALLTLVHQAAAHFVWVSIESSDGAVPTAHVYFSEAAHPDDGELLDGLSRLKVWQLSGAGEATQVKVAKTASEDGDFLAGKLAGDAGCVVVDCLYGVFGRGDRKMLLQYYAKAIPSDTPSKLARSEKCRLDVVPTVVDGKLEIAVFWEREPVADSEVVISAPQGKEHKIQTNADGKVVLDEATPGHYEIRAKRVEKSDGKFGDDAYNEKRFYCTVTYRISKE
ncbi:MAG: hypothetical protein MI757_18130 [Pirellulales bacterium]|nr:hypothetical protein [Pirellulales bacterium]